MPKGTRSGLLTRRRYLSYELRFEWAAATESNSGVKYRLLTFDRLGGRSAEPLGPEYQIADDNGDPGAKVDARQRSGALYSVIPVEKPAAKPLGEWNERRIVVTGCRNQKLSGRLCLWLSCYCLVCVSRQHLPEQK